MAASPTQRSLAALRAEGWLPWIVERYLAFVRKRVDLYNFADLVAIREGTSGVLAVQTTSASNMAARVKKVKATPEVRVWILGGNGIEVHGWAKRKGKWVCRRVSIGLEDLAEAPAAEVPG